VFRRRALRRLVGGCASRFRPILRRFRSGAFGTLPACRTRSRPLDGQPVRTRGLGLAVVELQRRWCETSPRSRNRARWTGCVRGRRPPGDASASTTAGPAVRRWRPVRSEPPHRTAPAGARHRGSARRRRLSGSCPPCRGAHGSSRPAGLSRAARGPAPRRSAARTPQHRDQRPVADPGRRRVEQARISAVASGSESRSGGHRRGLVPYAIVRADDPVHAATNQFRTH
jgi:hypothetical protein